MESLKMGVINFLTNMVVKVRESALLWQVFQRNEYLSSIAKANFEKALNVRGLKMSEAVLKRARVAAMKDKKLSIGQFLDATFKQ
jgi:hypothetical protein